MNNKILKIIIFVVVIIIIVIILLILSLKNSEIDENKTDGDIGAFEEKQEKISKVESKNSYYTIKNIVENYYLNLSLFNVDNSEQRYFDLGRYSTEEELEEERMIYKNKIYNFLSKEYIQKNGINIENIQDKLGKYNDLVVFTENMYFLDINNSIRRYFVEGYIVEEKTLQKTKFVMSVTTDAQNGTFEIYPSYEEDIKEGRDLEINIDKIENRKDNKYNFRDINTDIHVKELFKMNRYRLKYDLQEAYSKLDENYKEARFGNFENFKEYMQKNYDKLINAQLYSYQVTEKDTYTQFVCIDTNGKYYIIKETGIMQYTLILDTYTINIPEFLEKYEKARPEEKVILNINKFMQAINDENYKYAYSILADSFKEKNFTTIESFEEYIKSNFFKNNKFSYEKFGNEANMYYTYDVNITDATLEESGSDVKKKTFIILLEEGTDFKLSFNI